jgi:hypothetical protein
MDKPVTPRLGAYATVGLAFATSRAAIGGPCPISSRSLKILPVPLQMRSGGQATTRAKDGLTERLRSRRPRGSVRRPRRRRAAATTTGHRGRRPGRRSRDSRCAPSRHCPRRPSGENATATAPRACPANRSAIDPTADRARRTGRDGGVMGSGGDHRYVPALAGGPGPVGRRCPAPGVARSRSRFTSQPCRRGGRRSFPGSP